MNSFKSIIDWVHPSEAGRLGEIGRREFIKGTATLGALALHSTSAIAEDPNRGGHLILGLDGSSSAEDLDPGWGAGTYINVVKMLIYDNLIEVDENLAVQPSLAERWEASDDLRRWSVQLRKGIAFHNGKELTAADVIYSIQHHRKPDSRSPSKALLEPIKQIKAASKYELEFILETSHVDFPYVLSEFRLGICPDGGDFQAGVGTGPFVIESFEPGVRTIVRRNPNYWRGDRGFLDSIEVLAINDSTARISALQSSAIHMANHIPPKIVGLLESNPSIQIWSVPGGSHYTFPMRCDTAPFNDNDVRLALKYAIDREAIVRTVLGGHGEIGNDQPIASVDPFYATDIPQRPVDPERAKFHFKKSGYDGPIVLTVAEVGFQGAVEAAQLYQSSAASAGIELVIERVPDDGYFSEVWRTKPFTACYWGAFATAGLALSSLYKSGVPWNDTFWSRPEFDALLLASQAERDLEKRKQLFREMQWMIHEDGGQLLHAFNNVIDAGRSNVRGFVGSPIAEMGGFKAPSRLWLSE